MGKKTQKNKVLMISYQYPPDIGGAGVVAQDVARLLQNDVDITLLTLDKGSQVKETFQVIQAKTQRPIRFLGLWKIIKKTDTSQYKKIILNDTGSCVVAALFFPSDLKKKCIIYLHGSEPENIFQKPEIMLRLLSFKNKYIELLRQCAHIIAVSDYMKNKFLEMTKLTEYKTKISVINNGVNPDLFYRKKNQLKTHLNIPSTAKVLLTTGRVTKKKGFDKKLEYFEDLTKKLNCYWVIIGNGTYKSTLKVKIDEKELSDKIIWIDRIPREKLADYYSMADLFWLLSEYNEAFGLVYIEANFCGCPVLGNNKGGVPYIIEEGVTGYVVTANEPIQAIIQKMLFEKDFKPQVIRLAVEKYSLEHTKYKLINLINN